MKSDLWNQIDILINFNNNDNVETVQMVIGFDQFFRLNLELVKKFA